MSRFPVDTLAPCQHQPLTIEGYVMSILSAILAEQNNKIKEEWLAELRQAYSEMSWDKVNTLIKKLEDYYFSE